jgi:hypothetical protein
MKDYWSFECDCGHRWEAFIYPGFDGFVECPACHTASWCKDISKRHLLAGTYTSAPASTRGGAGTIFSRSPWADG